MHRIEREKESCLICVALELWVICFYLSMSIKLPHETLRLYDVISKDIQLKLFHQARKEEDGMEVG